MTRSTAIFENTRQHGQSMPGADKNASRKGDLAAPKEMSGDEKDRHFVTALARGLQVLQCFKSGEERLGNQELAGRCSLPKSTVTRLTYTLTKLGFLHHVEDSGRYRLGMSTLTLGGTTLSRLDVKEIGRPLMQDLANSTGSMVALGMRDGMSMLYIETCRSHSFVTLNLNLGSRIPVATTAMGRACMASMKPSARRALEERIRLSDPQSWAQAEAGIHKAIAELEAVGCCSSFGDWRSEVHAIASPIKVGKDMPLMVVSASGPAQSMAASVFMRDVRPELLATVRKIEQQIRMSQ